MSINFYAEIEHQTWVNDYAMDTGERTTLTPEQTLGMLDALTADEIEHIAQDGTHNEAGDEIAYEVEKAGLWSGPAGPFSVYLYTSENVGMDDEEIEEAMAAYTATRDARGIPESGDDTFVRTLGMRSKVEEINRLIASLPREEQFVFLAVDGSWGDAHDLRIERFADLTGEDRDNYEIED